MADPLAPFSELLTVREAAAQRLREAPYFGGARPVPVLTHKEGDLQATLDEQLGKLGVCAVVMLSLGNFGEADDVPQVLDLEVFLAVLITEVPLLNADPTTGDGTGKAAESLVVAACWALQGQPNGLPRAGRAANTFRLHKRLFRQVPPPPTKAGQISPLIYSVDLRTRVLLQRPDPAAVLSLVSSPPTQP